MKGSVIRWKYQLWKSSRWILFNLLSFNRSHYWYFISITPVCFSRFITLVLGVKRLKTKNIIIWDIEGNARVMKWGVLTQSPANSQNTRYNNGTDNILNNEKWHIISSHCNQEQSIRCNYYETNQRKYKILHYQERGRIITNEKKKKNFKSEF